MSEVTNPSGSEPESSELDPSGAASPRLTQPYSYAPDAKAGDLIGEFASLEPGTETDRTVTVAGRLMLRRVQGKLAFGTLQDATGRIQLFARAQATPDFDAFCGLALGDWVGVTGIVMTTRRGELSIRVDDWHRLAETRRPFPDKFHGIADQDLRYRQRYVDLWVTETSRDVLLARSRILSLVRRFMEGRDYVEVETPILHPIPGGAAARPFSTMHNALGEEFFLRIAPELYLKRLVVGGIERVFELGRVFRNEGMSNRHNPEFTMLEAYEAYGDYRVHMELTEQLVAWLATEIVGSTTVTYGGRELDLSAPWRRATLADLTSEVIGEEVSIDTPIERLRELCAQHEVPVKDSYGPGKLLLELYEKTTEATLWQPTFVTDYPVEVSPLSRVHREHPQLTERFEGIVAGRELCNGFSELTDPATQLARFGDQVAAKEAGDDEAMSVDADYVRALEFGLPPTVGLGIGIDRLVMLLTDSSNIRDVLLFPTLRPEEPFELVVE